MNRRSSGVTGAGVMLAAAMLVLAGCADEGEQRQPPAATTAGPAAQEPVGKPLSTQDIQSLAAAFVDQPLTGGQKAPRLYRWVNEDTAIFVQFDKSDVKAATALRYVGVSVKGVFCKEAQPVGFPHFHRVDAAEYGEGHGGAPGAQGYWLSWVAVDSFAVGDGRVVKPGVDYDFSPTTPPACGASVPTPDFAGPGARKLSTQDIQAMASMFGDQLLTGGQTAPRLYRWVNENTAIFVQFDKSDIREATALRYLGISLRGTFCASAQPSQDFPHFHRIDAPEYAKGHGQQPNDRGYWLLWMATDTFPTRDGRTVTPGVDREFSPTPAPGC